MYQGAVCLITLDGTYVVSVPLSTPPNSWAAETALWPQRRPIEPLYTLFIGRWRSPTRAGGLTARCSTNIAEDGKLHVAD